MPRIRTSSKVPANDITEIDQKITEKIREKLGSIEMKLVHMCIQG